MLNIVQADSSGCHIITDTNDLIPTPALLGTDLTEFSVETVKMFRADAVAAGFALST